MESMNSCSLKVKQTPPTTTTNPESSGFFSRYLGVDLRSLALMRVILGILLLADLFYIRFEDIRSHYSDFGVLPRGPYLEHFAKDWHWSIHLMSGEVSIQVLLFLIAGLCAFFMMIGFHTRIFTFLSWFLLVSLHSRNPMVLQGGDSLLRMLLFWSMFLPLGARFSVDEALNTNPSRLSRRVLSFPSAALLLQTCFVYWFTWILKDHPIWHEGQAAYYALQVDHFVTPLGKWLLTQSHLLAPLSLATYWWELIGPCLVFLPFFMTPLRILVVLLMIAMHFSFGRTLEIGLFQFVSMTSWIPFIPSGAWEWFKLKLRTKRRLGLRIYYDGNCGFCLKLCLILRSLFLLRETTLLPAGEKKSILKEMEEKNSWVVVDHDNLHHYEGSALVQVFSCSPVLFPLGWFLNLSPVLWMINGIYRFVARNRNRFSKLTGLLSFRDQRSHSGFLSQVLALFFLFYVFAWNVRYTDFKKWTPYFSSEWNWIGRVFRTDQYWNMFAPYPLRDDGWYIITGKLANGKSYSVFSDTPEISWEKPELVSAMYSSQRWRKYMMNLWQKKHKDHRLYYGRYLCRNFKRDHPNLAPLETFRIYYMREDTREEAIQTPKPVMVWKHRCFQRK